MSARVASFVKERNEALFSLDPDRIKAYFNKQGAKMPEDDVVFWAIVYKCICHITSAPAELVYQAKDWLYSHGMTDQIWP